MDAPLTGLWRGACGSKDNKIVRDFVVQCYLAWLIRVPLGPPLVPSVLSEVKEFSLVPLGLGKGVRPTEHSQGNHCYGRIPIASIPWLPPYYSVRKKSLSPEITRLISATCGKTPLASGIGTSHKRL